MKDLLNKYMHKTLEDASDCVEQSRRYFLFQQHHERVASHTMNLARLAEEVLNDDLAIHSLQDQIDDEAEALEKFFLNEGADSGVGVSSADELMSTAITDTYEMMLDYFAKKRLLISLREDRK